MSISRPTKNRKGFTLIELLVVISIIGLLSSVVLASLATARDKGRVAAGIQFADHNYHAFGADAIGIWNFNEGSGSINSIPARDNSGNNISLQAANSGITVSRSSSGITPTGSGYSLKLDTAADIYAISATVPQQIAAPTYITASAWVFISSMSGGNALLAVSTVNDWRPVLIYGDDSGNIYCYSDFWGDSYVIASQGTAVNGWHHVACSVNNKTGKATVYFDGKQIGQTYSFAVYPNFFVDGGKINNIYVGADSSWFGNYPYFKGYMDDVAVYTSALTASEVGKLYAEGLKDHQNLAQK